MITLRSVKGYALTHEELDQNFREFDEDVKGILGLETYCPIGDRYIYDIGYRTDKNYALIGGSPLQSGIMGASTLPANFDAIVEDSTTIHHAGSIIPTDFANFSLAETLNEYVSVSEYDTDLDLLFAQDIDLITIESDIVTKSITHVKYIPYVDGFLIGDTTLINPSVDYVAYSGTGDVEYIPFQIGTVQTIPATFNDLDPFGDGSQVHLFHFENNLIDGMGNTNIIGSPSFTNHVWSGANALLLKNDAQLTLAPDTTNMLVNGGWCVTTAFSRGSGTQAWLGDGLGLIYSHSKSVLDWNDGVSDTMLLYYNELYAWDYIYDIKYVFDKVAIRPVDNRVESGHKVYAVADPYEYAIGAYQVRYKGGKTYEQDTGWARPNGVAFEHIPPVYTKKDDTTALPTLFTFDKPSLTAPNSIETEVDEMRIFNRPLNPVEVATVTVPSGETHPVITSTTTTEWGIKGIVGIIDINGLKQSADIDINGTYYSFGTATVDEASNKITYQYRIAYGTKKLKIRIGRDTNMWNGENFIIRGYKKV